MGPGGGNGFSQTGSRSAIWVPPAGGPAFPFGFARLRIGSLTVQPAASKVAANAAAAGTIRAVPAMPILLKRSSAASVRVHPNQGKVGIVWPCAERNGSARSQLLAKVECR